MKAHIIIDKRKIIEDNKDTIKECLNVTLDEEYDYLEVLKTNEADEETQKPFIALTKDHEELRRALIDDTLTDVQVEEVGIVVRHRRDVMARKLQELTEATKIMSSLAKNFES